MEKISDICQKPLGRFVVYLLVSLLFRFPSLFIGYADIDELIWGLFANALVDGGTPYKDVMGEKPPLLYLFYALFFFLFGKHNYFAIHIAGIFWTGLTAYFIHSLVSRYLGFRTALFAALASVIFGSAPGFRILATTGELIMNLPLVLSCIFFLRGTSREGFRWFYLSGMAVVAAALVRQQSIIQLGAFALFIFMTCFGEGGLGAFMKKAATRLSGLLLGSVTAVILCLAYIVVSGAWDDFILWVVRHNYFYIKSGFLNDSVVGNFQKRTGHFVIMTLPLWILGLKRFGSVILGWWQNRSDRSHFELLMCLYLVVSFVAVIPGGRFFQHYYLQLLQPLSILAAAELVSLRSTHLLKKFSYAFFWFLVFRIPYIPVEMTLGNTTGDYSPLNETVGHYIRENSEDTDRIFVWGWNQSIYYHARRDPASRFISSDFLTGRSPSQREWLIEDTSHNITPGSWEMLMTDFSRHPPLYIVDTSTGDYHNYDRYPVSKFPLLKKILDGHYVLEISIGEMDLYRRVGNT